MWPIWVWFLATYILFPIPTRWNNLVTQYVLVASGFILPCWRYLTLHKNHSQMFALPSHGEIWWNRFERDSVGEPAGCIQKTSKVNQPQIFCMFTDPKHPHSAYEGSKSKHILPVLLLVPASPFSQKIDDLEPDTKYWSWPVRRISDRPFTVKARNTSYKSVITPFMEW